MPSVEENPRSATAAPDSGAGQSRAADEIGAMTADRGLLLGRAAAGLAHEAKNPLHTMALHLQLMAEKLAQASGAPDLLPPGVERHLQSLRDGIAKVDRLLQAFAEVAAAMPADPSVDAENESQYQTVDRRADRESASRLAANERVDLGEAVSRAILVFGFDARHHDVKLASSIPPSLRVRAAAQPLADLIGHALLAFVALAGRGGTVLLEVAQGEGQAMLSLHASPDAADDAAPGGQAAQLRQRAVPASKSAGLAAAKQSAMHLAAVRRLARTLGCTISIEETGQGSARLSLPLPLPA